MLNIHSFLVVYDIITSHSLINTLKIKRLDVTHDKRFSYISYILFLIKITQKNQYLYSTLKGN